jgi:hypothetical protein
VYVGTAQGREAPTLFRLLNSPVYKLLMMSFKGASARDMCSLEFAATIDVAVGLPREPGSHSMAVCDTVLTFLYTQTAKKTSNYNLFP